MAVDEPYMEVFKAMQAIPEATVFVTGRSKNAQPEVLCLKPDNSIVTDFIPEKEYIELLHAVDIIIDLTSIEDCPVCGAYEAIAAGKPLILSNTRILTEYFNDGVVHCFNKKEHIRTAILETINNLDCYKKGISRLHIKRNAQWHENFRQLCELAGIDGV